MRGGELPVTVGRREYLLGGDVIFEVNGIRLRDEADLKRAVESLEVGKEAAIKYLHGREVRTATIELPERPQLEGDAWWRKRRGK